MRRRRQRGTRGAVSRASLAARAARIRERRTTMYKSFGESIIAAVQKATEAVEHIVDSAVGMSQEAEVTRHFDVDGPLVVRLEQKSGAVRVTAHAEPFV